MAFTGSLSVRDRTSEFNAILSATRAASFAKGASYKPAPGLGPLPATQHPPHGAAPRVTAVPRSDFARLAAQVSADIANTSVKLGKLTQLAQRKSLFDDPTAEIQELTFVIKQDLGALNARLDDLQRLRDATRRSANRQAGAHSENVVDSLKSRLGETAEGFKSVLKLRTESLAVQQDRRSQFMGAPGSGTLAGHNLLGPPQQNGNARQARIGGDSGGAVALDLGGGSLGTSTSTDRGVEQAAYGGQALSLMRPRQDMSYPQARADAVREVESTIVELGQIFNQLATMVSEQGEMVERIDANVDETVHFMDSGQNQLTTYYNSISGNRAMILKVFGIMLMFLVLWTVIL